MSDQQYLIACHYTSAFSSIVPTMLELGLREASSVHRHTLVLQTSLTLTLWGATKTYSAFSCCNQFVDDRKNPEIEATQ